MGLIFHARPDATICCALILEIEWIGFFLFLPPAQDIMWVERGGGRRCRWRGGVPGAPALPALDDMYRPGETPVADVTHEAVVTSIDRDVTRRDALDARR